MVVLTPADDAGKALRAKVALTLRTVEGATPLIWCPQKAFGLVPPVWSRIAFLLYRANLFTLLPPTSAALTLPAPTWKRHVH